MKVSVQPQSDNFPTSARRKIEAPGPEERRPLTAVFVSTTRRCILAALPHVTNRLVEVLGTRSWIGFCSRYTCQAVDHRNPSNEVFSWYANESFLLYRSGQF